MRVVAIIGLLCLVLAGGCKRPDDNGSGPIEELKFSTQYDPIIACYANSQVHFSFTVKVQKGDISKNKLTCSITNVPTGTKVNPPAMVVGHLLGGVFSFDVGNLPVGDYNMQFVISSPVTDPETHNIVLRVKAPIDYAGKLAGTYGHTYDFCMPSTILNYSSVVTAIPDTPYKVRISNINNMGPDLEVRAWVKNGVVIPLQQVGGRTIWGRGTFSTDGRPGHENDYVLNINDTFAIGVDTQRCTVHIEH